MHKLGVEARDAVSQFPGGEGGRRQRPWDAEVEVAPLGREQVRRLDLNLLLAFEALIADAGHPEVGDRLTEEQVSTLPLGVTGVAEDPGESHGVRAARTVCKFLSDRIGVHASARMRPAWANGGRAGAPGWLRPPDVARRI
jgi:hypothetical protein